MWYCISNRLSCDSSSSSSSESKPRQSDLTKQVIVGVAFILERQSAVTDVVQILQPLEVWDSHSTSINVQILCTTAITCMSLLITSTVHPCFGISLPLQLSIVCWHAIKRWTLIHQYVKKHSMTQKTAVYIMSHDTYAYLLRPDHVEVEVEQSLTPHPTQYRSFRRRVRSDHLCQLLLLGNIK